MSDAGGSQPPSVAKPKVAMSSAFIDKGGKKFAPKVKARRRPGAGGPPASSTTSQLPPPAAPIPLEQTQPVQLPTPTATQATPQALPNEQFAATSIVSAPEPATVTPAFEPTIEPTAVEEDVANAPAAQEDIVADVPATRPEEIAVNVSAVQRDERVSSPATRPAEELESGRSPKRRRVEIPEGESGGSTAAVPQPNAGETSAAPHTITEGVSPTTGITNGESMITDQETAAGPRRPNLPWATVNTPQDENVDAATTATKRKGPAKRKRGAATLQEINDEERGGEEQEDIAPRQPSAKARGKRKARDEATGEQPEITAPARRPRKTRKRAATEGDGQAEAEVGEAGEAAPECAQRKRAPKTKASSATPALGEAATEGDQQPRRKGRPPREDTPSDAENEVINEAETMMHSIASRNIRVGKLSEREKKMRLVNWDDVNKKRRAAEALHADHRRQQAEDHERRIAEQETLASASGAGRSGPQFHVVDGQIQLMESARVHDEAAIADRERDAMLTVVEDDVTKRITYKSFLRNSKRNPSEFMLPGQGKRWSNEATERFYQALGMLGTDFMMISTMFPGSTRRSIKLKFVREERANPERVAQVLRGQINTDWDAYIKESGREDETFREPDLVKAELAAEREEMMKKIREAKEAAEEERRQRRIAGVLSEDEGAAGDKAKKKRGRKDRTVTFAEEDGVEVLGTIDQDDGWGQE